MPNFDNSKNMEIKPKFAVRALAALAQESRLAIYRLLVQAGPVGLVAGQIGDALGIAPATLSFHLKTLAHSGLVTQRQEGRFVRYSADFNAMHALIDYLSANCCGSDRSACLPLNIQPEDQGMNASTPKTVLVLCTGNSCRSQMAEVLLNHDLAGRVRAISAGIRPQPKVAEGAITALREAGLPTEGLYPKDVDAVINEPIDLVVTVCDNAKESCPVFPRPVKTLHLPFHDPHGEPVESFRRVRDDIRARLIPAVREALGL